ncbi:hypothetical protein [Parasphingorhabdus halotolerans]|uniref:Uncharacterized protein n=1 Tax=Parasphingorhabdus halotolerans TaxID=2725558 RepID=A0A6H2DKM2_9SPHN|nr:hypothetical protein [Parasphingorhabdus halotolerans]QJB68894.1 hypothetical protein HF685_06070 [Parasphingorhabdus halotolerans]
MRSSIKYIVALPMFLGLAAPAAMSESEQIELTERQQTKLDARLAGRTPGKPVSCITRWDQKHMTVISDDIILFGQRRNSQTIYVNKPYLGCNSADKHSLVTRSYSNGLCKGDMVVVTDLQTQADVGSCVWSEFVPYTKDAS